MRDRNLKINACETFQATNTTEKHSPRSSDWRNKKISVPLDPLSGHLGDPKSAPCGRTRRQKSGDRGRTSPVAVPASRRHVELRRVAHKAASTAANMRQRHNGWAGSREKALRSAQSARAAAQPRQRARGSPTDGIPHQRRRQDRRYVAPATVHRVAACWRHWSEEEAG